MHAEETLLGLALILVLGIAAQWIAWRTRIPSILALLLVGFGAGNLGELLAPDRLLGHLLFPFVSLAVAIILFEGGLSLRFADFRHVGGVVVRLLTVGVAATFAVATGAALVFAGLPWRLALLVGAILTVTGPTVIGPLLAYVRPKGRVGPILSWEGILVDPIGALIAVLVFQAVRAGGEGVTVWTIATGVLWSVVIGVVLGGLGAALIVVVLRRNWMPDPLENPFALALIVSAHVLSNRLHPEAGLFTVTLMGVALANQRVASVRHIVQFKEVLRTLLISSLFILLAARVKLETLTALSAGSFLFVAALILVARPLSVLLATWGSDLTTRERVFLAWMAPRGVVAASVTSIFALDLARRPGMEEAARLVPLVFLVIVATVTIYGLSAKPLARRFGLADEGAYGVVILGASPFAVALGRALQTEGIPVLVVDSNRAKVVAARLAGLTAWHGNALAENAVREMPLAGMGKLLALTTNDEANSLAALRYSELFGRAEVFQVAPERSPAKGKDEGVSFELRGHLLFGADVTARRLDELVEAGWVVRRTALTDRFGFAELRSESSDLIPLFVLREGKRLQPFGAATNPVTGPGSVVLSLVAPAVKERGVQERMRAENGGRLGSAPTRAG